MIKKLKLTLFSAAIFTGLSCFSMAFAAPITHPVTSNQPAPDTAQRQDFNNDDLDIANDQDLNQDQSSLSASDQNVGDLSLSDDGGDQD